MRRGRFLQLVALVAMVPFLTAVLPIETTNPDVLHFAPLRPAEFVVTGSHADLVTFIETSAADLRASGVVDDGLQRWGINGICGWEDVVLTGVTQWSATAFSFTVSPDRIEFLGSPSGERPGQKGSVGSSCSNPISYDEDMILTVLVHAEHVAGEIFDFRILSMKGDFSRGICDKSQC